MKRIALGLCAVLAPIAVLAMVSGCGTSDAPSDGGDKGLPDGFVSNTCATASDCAPTDCQTAKCNAVTKMCEYKEKLCPDDTECSKGVCDVNAGGTCVQQPANDGVSCSTVDGDPGTCASGTCSAVPSCAPASSFFTNDAECDSANASVKQDNNGPGTFSGGTPVVGAYPCAPTEAGPEVAYTLNHESSAGDEDITISLVPVNPDGTPASADDKDLDLIILEDACTGTAKCMNPAAGAGFQGVTTGTAKERVTFHAAAGKTYYVVVDGKDMNQIKDYIIEVEACGKCQPTDATRLDCNMTMPISASTATGAAQITDYKCGAAMTPVAAAGKELPFYFRTLDGAVRNVTATLTGATAAYTMLALPTTIWGQCDPDNCVGSVTGASGSNMLTWKVDPDGRDFARYWLVVDTPAMADTDFGIELSCAPYCNAPDAASCGGGAGTENNVVNGTTIGGATQAAKWGPAAGCDGLTGLTGPESAVSFVTKAIGGGQYDVKLASMTAGKNLSITVMDGGATTDPACDPTFACVANTALTTGFTSTHTTAGNTTPAGIHFTAVENHTYFFIVDGTDASGADFKLQVVGSAATPGAGCP